MTEARLQPDELSIEAILDKISPIKFERPLKFSSPYEEDDKTRGWFKEKAILLRHVFERYPSHDAALSCLLQYCHLETAHPLLVAATHAELKTKEIQRLSDLQGRNDTGSKKYLLNYRRAFQPIEELQYKRAKGILSEHPNLGLAEWAYHQLILRQGLLLMQGTVNTKKISRLTEELIQTVENYRNYQSQKHSSIEPFEGYFELCNLLGVDFLIHAVDALAPKGRALQSRLLERISKLFPDSVQVTQFINKLNSFEEKFVLTFTDLTSGKCINTKDYRGKVLIVDFWATWCQPCLTFVPYMKKILSKHSNGIQVIGISNDDAGLGADAAPDQRRQLEAEVIECASKHGMDWPISLDSKIHEKWCIFSIPTVFVVDQRGILRSLDARKSLAKTVRNLLRDQKLSSQATADNN